MMVLKSLKNFEISKAFALAAMKQITDLTLNA